MKLYRLAAVGLLCGLTPLLVMASDKRTRTLSDEVISNRPFPRGSEPADAPAATQVEEVPKPRKVQSDGGDTAPPIVVGDVEGPRCCGWNPCCGGDGPLSRLWVNAELLLWWSRANSTPPLVTTGPNSSAGILGLPGTVVLAGGTIDHSVQAGGRFTLGYWFDDCKRCGIEGNYFVLGTSAPPFVASSLGNPILARPFFNTDSNREDIEQIANPAIANPIDPSLGNLLPLTGTVTVVTRSRLQGAEVNFINNLGRDPCRALDVLYGFRFMNLDEGLTIGEDLTVPAGSPQFAGTQFNVLDDFGARNEFYGGQLGIRGRIYRGNWQLDLIGKLALGSTHQTVTINGSTRTREPNGATTTQTGGLLAQTSNIGRYSQDQFSVIPELGIKLGYQITPCLRATLGYTFVYWSNVVRPGEHIDRDVNPNLLPNAPGPQTGPARPAFVFNTTDFWAQGLTFGLEYQW